MDTLTDKFEQSAHALLTKAKNKTFDENDFMSGLTRNLVLTQLQVLPADLDTPQAEQNLDSLAAFLTGYGRNTVPPVTFTAKDVRDTIRPYWQPQ